MARILAGDEGELFRAAITVKFRNDGATVFYRGPFLSKGQATTAIGRLKNEAQGGWTWWLGRDADDLESIEGVVERSPLTWGPVE